ncbi:hypothetical protein [Streptococcus oricebi]|uniref:Uncharacterized protein n=1 Tax=Streptococcus oricebi TaxID=1547447 RepID=A0ABS5B5S6_9STRE|nr:hypothetical protein [Streptococcus oricebi]MBP2624188.1 hypothetical protein [Streptococcus oricebi]
MTNNTEKKKGFLGNLNERERKIITVLGAGVVVGLAGLMINGMYTKNSQLSEEYQTIKLELDGKTSKINQKANLTKQLTKLNSEALKQASKYYGDTNQGEFIYLIDDFINKSKITLKKVNFNETTELEFPESKDTRETKKKDTTSTDSKNATTSASSGATSTSSSTSSSSSSATSSSSETSASSSDTNASSTASSSTSTQAEGKPYENTNITQMTADIEFRGTYTQVLALLDLIDKNQQTIVSSELELNEPEHTGKEDNDPIQDGKIKLRFYQVQDVERYVSKPVSMIEKTPIPFANLVSPFARPVWLANKPSSDVVDNSNGNASTTNNLGEGLGSANSNLSPSYLEQLNSLSSNNGLSAYFNSSTIYNFESDLKLTQDSSKPAGDVGVDRTDFLEGAGSNVLKLPATKGTTLFEMQFAAPFVTLNDQPENINFSMSLSNEWKGKVGMIVKNSSGQKIYLHLLQPTNWTGWREIGFNPANIPGFSYPMTILGFYFETPSGNSPETTIKLDNLAVSHLTTN